jgi:hypothetical protein
VRIPLYMKLSFLCAIALATSIHAGPPETLNFSTAQYVKIQQELYGDPVKRICLKSENDDAYPSVVVFGRKILFLTPNGSKIGQDSLPQAKEIKITQSAEGNLIYVFGPLSDSTQGAFHRLYKSTGELVLNKIDNITLGAVGMGIPLERSNTFVMGGFGKATLTNFNGNPIAQKQFLNKDNYEDGDIYTSVVPGESTIFMAVNRFKVPIGNDNSVKPILYAFDSKLNEISHDTLDGAMALSLTASENGKYLILREESSEGGSPLWIVDLYGKKLKNFDNPRVVAIAASDNYLIQVPRGGRPEIYSTADWSLLYTPDLPSMQFPWIDAVISNNGSMAILYNGDDLALLDIKNKSWSMVHFPYAFENCRFYENGQKLVLRGEFGYVIYRLTL